MKWTEVQLTFYPFLEVESLNISSFVLLHEPQSCHTSGRSANEIVEQCVNRPSSFLFYCNKQLSEDKSTNSTAVE